ncbi:hypothetical protein [Sulfitobacter sp.]|uniref:hypothetical protein n=1 Tax=Sulfitobacter sp. TaxID=1903071 RepID=UPI003002DD61
MVKTLNEKQRYWEGRLGAVLSPIPINDLLVMSWAIEAFRNGREALALTHASIPGELEDHKIGGRYFIPPWNIDAVINERLVLGIAPNPGGRHLNLKSWGAITKLLNTYSGLANVESVKDFDGNEIIAAMPRLFWPQYDWQLGFENSFRIGRAWHVYVTPAGKKAFAKKHSIDLELFLKVTFAIYALTEKNPAARASSLEAVEATKAEVFQIRKIIGETVNGHVTFAQSIRNSNIPRDFKRSVVKERPLFEIDDRQGRIFLVPSREQLLLRITDGLYYDIVQDSNARRVSGDYFEDLCFQLIKHYYGTSSDVDREKDTSYGKSADLFVMDKASDLGIVVECKIRRIPQRILTSPDPWRDCEADFDDLIKGVVQIWRTNSELFSTSDRSLVGVVLLYDPWTMMGNSFLEEIFLRAGREADDLSVPECERIPVTFAGLADFETCLREYSVPDIHKAVCRSNDYDFHGHLLSGILSSIAEKGRSKARFDYGALAKSAVSWWGK